jgi:alkaline phosphatase D
VANPEVSAAQVRVQGTSVVGDRRLKREGYGIVEVDKIGGHFRIHCWPWDRSQAEPRAAEYPGWPYTLPFAEL